MTMQNITAPETSTSIPIERAPWDTTSPEFLLPDGEGTAEAVVAEEAVVEEAPPSDLIPRTEFDAIKKQAEELATWKAELERRAQEVTQQQQTQQVTDTLGNVEKYFTDYGVPADDAKFFREIVRSALWMQSPEFTQRNQHYVELQQQAHAWELLKSFPPNTTLKTLLEHEAEIGKYPDKERREWAAQQRKAQVLAANQQARQQTGAERVERGGGGTPSYGSPRERYLEALKKGDKSAFSKQEIDRMTAAYLNG